ncbi:proprotein convertase subtilisin/kexin type 1 [Paragonimus westermani]|uniref:Proprotein convertase subtilisin/kexin type 1 n=1 Tax=Paragonimus westermani TaxID=34504 RepID=A0A5J4NZ90_9TREM|nr:proprotein convertase subtilisin/kexin type 1 [Paragonimus westermani]
MGARSKSFISKRQIETLAYLKDLQSIEIVAEVRLVHQPPLRISKRSGDFYENRPEFDVAAAKNHSIIKKPDAIKLPSDAAYEEQFKKFAEILKRLVKFSDAGAAYTWQYLSLAVPQTNTHADKTKSEMKTGKTADKVGSQDTEIKRFKTPVDIQHTMLKNDAFKYPSSHSGPNQTGKKTVEQSTEKKSSTGSLLMSVSNQLRPKSRGATEKKLLKMLNDGEEMKIAFPSKQGKQDYEKKSKEWLETRHDVKRKLHDHSKSEDLVAHPYREDRSFDNAGRLHRRRLDVLELEDSRNADMDRRPRVHYHGRIRPYSREEQLNDGTRGSELIGYDLNVYPLYALGVSGKDVNALILDDALDTEHFDLKDNFNPDISVNLNDADVTVRGPNRFMGEDDRHGTQCAGLLAAVANNDYCSHGVAYKAKVGIVRMLAGLVTDILEATSIDHMHESVDIYVASWGPKDDGQTMDKPRIHAYDSLQHSSGEGRNGRGSLFIFASGNGGHLGDHCGADGFVGSPFVIAVTALDSKGNKAVYSESCASIRFAVPVGSPQIFDGPEADILPSTTGNNECMLSFVGTSAAAPLAAGCIALLLEIRPELSARDVENILPWSARIPNPTDTDWQVNGAGVMHNSHTGFGLLDCSMLLYLGRSWAILGPSCVATEKIGTAMPETWGLYQDAIPGDKTFRHIKHLNDVHDFQRELRELITSGTADKLLVKRNGSDHFTLMFKSVDDIPKSAQIAFSCVVEVVEKVVVTVQWKHICRGSMSIWLKSPSGTRVTILGKRPNDTYAGEGTMQFTSVTNWGELVDGDWVIGVDNDASCGNHIFDSNPRDELMGVVVFAEINLLGTTKKESAFEVNEELIAPLRTTVSHEAAEKGVGRPLTAEEVRSTFEQQRWIALNHSMEFVKVCFSLPYILHL